VPDSADFVQPRDEATPPVATDKPTMATGPVQLLVVSFAEPDFRGEVLQELQRLRENDTIRLIDALAVQKNAEGDLEVLQWSDLSVPEAEEFGATVGALLGLGMAGTEGMEAGAIVGADMGADGHVLDAEMWDVADLIQPGSAAAVALIEHVWARPLRDAIARAGGVPVSDAWVHPLDLVEIGLLASDELEPA
jgi:uncharacterized membrane protein